MKNSKLFDSFFNTLISGGITIFLLDNWYLFQFAHGKFAFVCAVIITIILILQTMINAFRTIEYIIDYFLNKKTKQQNHPNKTDVHRYEEMMKHVFNNKS